MKNTAKAEFHKNQKKKQQQQQQPKQEKNVFILCAQKKLSV